MDTVDTRSASVPEDGEKIIEIQLERLRTFKNHPFKVRMDQEMIRLSASVEKYGIINPLIVRPIPDGVYEIISGHRRKAAAEKFGYRKVPVIIRVMSDDEAVINMVDSNLQREQITFSEKAFAYKMKNEALFTLQCHRIGSCQQFLSRTRVTCKNIRMGHFLCLYGILQMSDYLFMSYNVVKP